MPRRKEWVDTFVDQAFTSSTQQELSLISDQEDNKGKTLTRLIVDLVFTPTLPAIDQVDQNEVWAGVGLASPEVNVGTIAVATLADVPLSGWLMRHASIIRENPNSDGPYRLHADLGGKRKLMYGEPRLFLNVVGFTGTFFNTSVFGIVRTLYQLP